MTVLKSRDRRTDMRMRRFDIVEGGIVIDADAGRAEGILRDISNQGNPPPPASDLKLTGA
jgi:circadian clock protein KaiC